MSTVIFTAGAKGGTGKSTVSRFLITYLRERGHNPLLLDMDNETKTLSRFFPEAEQIEIRKDSSNDVLVEKVLAGNNLIIADLKAGTGRDTLQWWKDVPFDSDELKNVKFICVGSITSSPDSIQTFLNWAGELKDKVTYIVFKNEKDGDIFPDYGTSHESTNFRSDYLPIEINIPRIDEEYMSELERLNLTISEVLEANGAAYTLPDKNRKKPGKPIGDILCCLMVRARLRRFQNSIYDQFEPINKYLYV
jgi:hypothetical protein